MSKPNACWKCGNECEGVECEKCLSGLTEAEKAFYEKMVPINFAKVSSIEDLKVILSTVGLSVRRDSDLHRSLRRFTDS